MDRSRRSDRRCGRLAANSRHRTGRTAQHQLHCPHRRHGPGSQATFVTNTNQTNTAQLSSMPGNGFEASAVLADPHQAGMQVSIRWPSAAKVHCEIDVDDNVATQVDQFVQPAAGSTDPMNGVLPCGAPLPAT